MKVFKWLFPCKQRSLMQEFHTVFLCFKHRDSSWAHVILIRAQGIRYSRSDLIPWRAFSRTDSLIHAVLKLTAISSPLALVLFLLIRQNTPNPDRDKRTKTQHKHRQEPQTERDICYSRAERVMWGRLESDLSDSGSGFRAVVFPLSSSPAPSLSVSDPHEALAVAREMAQRKSTALKTHNERRAL